MIETLLPVSALAFPNIDPVIFSIGPLAVHWYGLGYVVGIMFAWWYGKKLLRNHRLWGNNQPPMQPEALDDFVIWAALGVVLGGRIGYVLFYNFSYYLQSTGYSGSVGWRHVIPWRHSRHHNRDDPVCALTRHQGLEHV